ncbi:cytochrome c3 family protein [Neobacillus cucumis]|uniref:cytochrome c3 family protein n=1 Tax=Neobacillus cucumis TaxID=1740721 RepID=UPI0015E10CBB|nr:cytochrome c3 family protein [Neobacillus cucumis]
MLTSIFSFQPTGVYSAIESQPSITIDSPSPDAVVNKGDVTISGTYAADNITKTDLLFSASENGNVISDSSANQSDWTIDDTSTPKTWSFTNSSLQEGSHVISVEVKNTATNDVSTATLSFTITNSTVITVPSISITTPQSDDILNSKRVEISGEYTADNVSKSDLQFIVFDENSKIISDSITNQSDWAIDESSSPKKWTFSTISLEEGEHNFTVQIKNLLTNETGVSTIKFTLFLTRPYVKETAIILADGAGRKGEDLTNVPLDAKLKITIVDDQQMNQLKNKIKNNNYDPIKILLGSNTLQGTTKISEPVVKDGKYYYDMIFTPNNNELKMNKTYLVYVDPQLMDDLDNPIFTKLFKFTTMTNVKWDDPDDPQSHASSNPHGHYKLNTNMCAACHRPHDSKSSSLTGGSYQIEFTEQLSKNQPANDPSQNYCMACHDGTLNAPSIENKDSQHLHGYTAANTVLKQQESCASCHNPHLEWSEENQNLLKDHYVYTHNKANPDQGLSNPTVDSFDTTCESCHDYIDFSTISSDKGKLETLAYNKSLTAKGTISDKLTDSTLKTLSDYSLCLRCHNAEKSAVDSNPSDIETLYLKQSSGHNFTLPADQQTQRDGSLLSGPIPCAECHETHGSNNLMNLREILGNNPGVSENDKFKTVGTTWNAANERNFCLNCHNKGREIYGKKAAIDSTISGHQADDVRGCSECHSDQTKTYKDFREQSMNAAHAPLAGVKTSSP